MNLYSRLAEIQCSLAKREIPKSGWNKHKGFKYHELEDLLPPIMDECMKHELTIAFTFVENAAILKLHDWKSKDEISFRIHVPDLVVPDKNPNNQLIQAVGANATYLKRYLLVNTFLIMEKEVIDAEDIDVPKKSAAPVKESTNKSKSKSSSRRAEKVEEPEPDINVGALIVEAEGILKKKGLSDNEITTLALQKQCLRLCETAAERQVVRTYFKKEAQK